MVQVAEFYYSNCNASSIPLQCSLAAVHFVVVCGQLSRLESVVTLIDGLTLLPYTTYMPTWHASCYINLSIIRCKPNVE